MPRTLTKPEIDRLEDTATCHCPACGKRLGEEDVDGGRCHGCLHSLCSVKLEELPYWEVATDQGTFIMHAETEKTIRAACKRKKLTIKSLRQMDPGEVPNFDWHATEGDQIPEWGYAWVCTTDEEGNEEDTLAFVPLRGWKSLDREALRDDRTEAAIDLAQFMAAAMNEYVKTPKGRAEWAKINDNDKKLLEKIDKLPK